jgi:hypothetical protein
MNPLILLFILNFSLPLLFGYGVEGKGFSVYFTNGYTRFCIRVYSIQRYIESRLVSEMFLGVSRSFHIAMFYL